MEQIVTVYEHHPRAGFHDPRERLLPDLCRARSGRSHNPIRLQVEFQNMLDRFSSQLVQAYPELEFRIRLAAERTTPIHQVRLNATINRGVNGESPPKVCQCR